METTAIAILTGYLLGSIPTAYLIVRRQQGIDIRKAGSGNVGTLNSFEVTRSKRVGVVVLLIDVLKGIAAVLLGGAIDGSGQTGPMAAGIAAVAGHNFPVWLGFKGGRGLATAAGVAAVLVPVLILVWMVLWAGAFAVIRRVNPASAVASVLAVPVLLPLPAQGPLAGSLPPEARAWWSAGLMVLILVRLAGPVRSYVHDVQMRRTRS